MSLSSEWGNLPEDILSAVFDKLFPYKEYTLCGTLCKSWLSAAAANLQRQQKRHGINARIPVIMLLTYSDEIPTWTCFSITTNNNNDNNNHIVLNTQLPPHLRDREIRGSSHGWLILVAAFDNKTSLFNPVRNQKIRIPPPPSKDEYMLGKMIVSPRRSCSPINESNFVVVATLEPLKSLCYFRSGDTNWIRVIDDRGKYWTNTCAGISNIEDIIFHNQSLLVLDSQNRLFALNFLSDDYSPEIRILKVVPIRERRLPGHVHYITKSSTGELLLILGYIVGSFIEELHRPILRDPSTMPFKVYKLGRLATGELDWIEAEGIGEDQVAFLGSHQSSCAKAPPGQRANCLYIAYDYWLVSGFFRELYNLGIYSFEDGSFRGVFDKAPPKKVIPYSITRTRSLATCFPVWLSLEMPKF